MTASETIKAMARALIELDQKLIELQLQYEAEHEPTYLDKLCWLATREDGGENFVHHMVFSHTYRNESLSEVCKYFDNKTKAGEKP
ncbi:MAG: hypothetical protein WC551_08780 [Patescibacteria group bacterium]